MTLEPLPIFVYGTLKRGEERARCWPRPPRLVEPATTRGRLFDLGPYPALVEGDDRVLGELWHIEPADMEATLKTLDAIECFGVEEVDLYVRRVVDCETVAGDTIRAYAYFLANPTELGGARAVPPDAAGLCHWIGKR